MRAFCRVHQINNIKKSSIQVHLKLLPKGDEAKCECSGVPLSCYKIFNLDISDIFDSDGCIKIILEEKPSLFSKTPKVLSFLELPLKWFEQDKTTRSKYPMQAVGLKDCIVDVEVHISTNPSTRPFDAPSGQLLVVPQWNFGSNENTDYHPPCTLSSSLQYSESNSREEPLLPQYNPTVYDAYQQSENKYVSYDSNPYTSATAFVESTTKNPYEI